MDPRRRQLQQRGAPVPDQLISLNLLYADCENPDCQDLIRGRTSTGTISPAIKCPGPKVLLSGNDLGTDSAFERVALCRVGQAGLFAAVRRPVVAGSRELRSRAGTKIGAPGRVGNLRTDGEL